MDWDWKAVRDNRASAADGAVDPQTAGRDTSTRRARPDVPPRGTLLYGTTYKCAFCRGEGERPAGAACPVCRRSGVVFLEPPVVTCGYCRGRGEAPRGSGMTCPVCRGPGKVSVKEPVETCPSCRGRGRKPGAALYCARCKGLGVAPVDAGKSGQIISPPQASDGNSSIKRSKPEQEIAVREDAQNVL